MKTLSIKQPWAGLILLGQKPVENRNWLSGHVGPMLIHASRDTDNNISEEIVEYSGLYKMELSELPMFRTGAIVGIVWKDSCFRACSRGGPMPTPSVWHDPGAVWWPLKHAAPLVEPIPAKGMLCLFDFEIDRETSIMHSKARTIGEWVKVFDRKEFPSSNVESEPVNYERIRKSYLDIYFSVKKIIAAAERFEKAGSPGEEELLQACRNAWRVVSKAESRH